MQKGDINMVPFKVDLGNEVIAITGAGGVLMSAFAKALAECGASVGIIDRNAEACAKVTEEINAAGGKAVSAPADCLSKADIEKAKGVIEKAFGKVTMLINGAGGNSPKCTTDNETAAEAVEGAKSFFDLDEAGFKFVFDLNILTAVLCTQVFAKDMADAGKGNIINISSMNAYRPLTKIPAYSSAKAGVSNLTQWLAVHFASKGIRVNAMAPGFFSTRQNAQLLWNADGTPTARTKKILDHTHMGRFGETKDLIGTLLWLADDKASGFVTGIVVPVDGGFSAYSGV